MKSAPKPRPRPREFVQEQYMDEILAAVEAEKKADGKR